MRLDLDVDRLNGIFVRIVKLINSFFNFLNNFFVHQRATDFLPFDIVVWLIFKPINKLLNSALSEIII